MLNPPFPGLYLPPLFLFKGPLALAQSHQPNSSHSHQSLTFLDRAPPSWFSSFFYIVKNRSNTKKKIKARRQHLPAINSKPPSDDFIETQYTSTNLNFDCSHGEADQWHHSPLLTVPRSVARDIQTTTENQGDEERGASENICCSWTSKSKNSLQASQVFFPSWADNLPGPYMMGLYPFSLTPMVTTQKSRS